MMTIRRAVSADLDTVLAVLHSVADWLHGRGYDQWPEGSPSLGPKKVRVQIARGDFWIVHSGRDPVAVIAVSPAGDTDFWSASELAEPAFYIAKAAVVRPKAGEGLGSVLLRWACDHAALSGARWVRLDAWKTNTDLHSYYLRQGWDYLRTVQAPRRNSGALFQRPAMPDPAARAAFHLRAAPPRSHRLRSIGAGSRVIVVTDDGPVAARVVEVSADWSYGITEAGWEHGGSGPPPLYFVERDGRTWPAPRGQLWLDPDQPSPRDVQA